LELYKQKRDVRFFFGFGQPFCKQLYQSFNYICVYDCVIWPLAATLQANTRLLSANQCAHLPIAVLAALIIFHMPMAGGG
jgi:hypothetical protein